MLVSPRAPVILAGLGVSLPPRIVSNDDLVAGGLDTSDEWIRSRTGIARRRWVTAGTSTSDLAVAAGRAAMRSAGSWDADLVLVATTTPDRRCPATAPEVAARLGLGDVPAFDLGAVCSGFLYGLAVTAALVSSGLYRRPLLIGAETYSTIIDPLDRDSAVIFGDGAGAVLLRRGGADEPGAITAVDLHSDGSGADLIAIEAGGSRLPDPAAVQERRLRYFRMRGREVYGQAVRRMTASSNSVLEQAGWASGEVEAFVGHQANQRILDAVADRLGIGAGRRFGNIADVGNTAAASIPLAMADAASRVRPGARTLLTAFGGGLTWGSVALTWPDAVPLHSEPADRAADERGTHDPDVSASGGTAHPEVRRAPG
ncbi:ketoacyl-ACP synthase III [Streptomyces coacervatus]|uniref:beta-ketoacyl-ACP synthase III n=1 Tax=Streptomyces coacervatus TaxID=647381 RepID=UPI0023DBC4D6|nr:beta-ketoacyl-ACP synthase III [Streptomyces coacervatus]MDF2265145.1 ketoacyl-ACP synthase III [Streptomyces coacervatus]